MSDFNRISSDVKMGKGVKVHGFVNLYGCSIGRDTRIGAFVEIQKGAKIGMRCKISSHSFICEGVRIGDRVFIGHGVLFTNDRYPRATRTDGEIETEADWKPRFEETFVDDDAVIGSGARIMPGIHIGKGAIVGLGAVVTKDVPAGAVATGVPARVVGKRDDLLGYKWIS